MRAPTLVLAFVVLSLATAFVHIEARSQARGDLVGCKANFKNIGCALEIYAVDHDGYYPASLDDLTPLYLKRLPPCPAAGYSTYRLTVGRAAPLNDESYEEYYLLECTGEAHESENVAPDFPKWASPRGLLEPRDL